ncbi:hypothetical protein K4785_001082 [Salmonella enterica subsp. enterica serovar Krefeld]|nr:hypothetical protein [Salmonella enterica subsp. enterica serovar Krefeld]EHY8763884.1 hypothetical protein [Salmonella enterica subsp. enterica serovar Krefeld]
MVSSTYGEENYKNIHFKNATINIPARWVAKKKDDCLLISKNHINLFSYLYVCTDVATNKNSFFTKNDDGEWEAVTDGVPVLADVNITPKFTGMSAIVSCRYKDDAGYHIDQCFQAAIVLPTKIMFVFIGRGDSSLFNNYKEIYRSFKVKWHVIN